MGRSVAGKTTCLNVIVQRKICVDGLKATGESRANGVLIEDFDYKSCTAYVMQDDVILESMTVEEAFLFAGELNSG